MLLASTVHSRHSHWLSLTTLERPHSTLPGRHRSKHYRGRSRRCDRHWRWLVTVKVAVAVLVSHLSVAVNVTVTLPPAQRSGAVGLLLVNTGAQPPPLLAVANHVAKAAFSAAWSAKSQAYTVAGAGAVITTGAGGVTVIRCCRCLGFALVGSRERHRYLPPVHRSGSRWIAIGQVLVHNRHSYSLSLTTFGTPHSALPGRHRSKHLPWPALAL